ncbi:unnamed protein product [Ambrosiozyma monospora]|uniref:Unnamed protein product n=1 Tax=Ambrosiozyma monospora TaxID=43982 RepID=A0A9W6WIJ4_AMBMO|nr:unnamed protein product [Ambrosiozyma monospora]
MIKQMRLTAQATTMNSADGRANPSLLTHNMEAFMAKLVRHRTSNAEILGSNPSEGIIFESLEPILLKEYLVEVQYCIDIFAAFVCKFEQLASEFIDMVDVLARISTVYL